jgi:hypothetical protein
MTELLRHAIAAHGGMERWRQLNGLSVRLSSGGALFLMKWKRQALCNIHGHVDLTSPRTILSPYPVVGHRGVFEPTRVWIENEDGRVLNERSRPRDAFKGFRHTLWWDHLDLLYFAGYALRNYLCAPFLFVQPGFETQEIGSWEENGERLRRLRVRFPSHVPSHCREQIFYFDESGLLRRLDYTAEVVGSFARAAHYCFDHQVFSGLVIPTRRKVVPRKPNDRAFSGPTLVWIDVNDVQPC